MEIVNKILKVNMIVASKFLSLRQRLFIKGWFLLQQSSYFVNKF